MTHSLIAQPWGEEEALRYANTASQCLSRHEHGFGWRSKADENLCRSNCGACVLGGYRDKDDTEHDPANGPNYAGWARIFVEAQRSIPAKWRAAFARELARTDNPAYVSALQRSVATFGVTFHG